MQFKLSGLSHVYTCMSVFLSIGIVSTIMMVIPPPPPPPLQNLGFDSWQLTNSFQNENSVHDQTQNVNKPKCSQKGKEKKKWGVQSTRECIAFLQPSSHDLEKKKKKHKKKHTFCSLCSVFSSLSLYIDIYMYMCVCVTKWTLPDCVC